MNLKDAVINDEELKVTPVLYDDGFKVYFNLRFLDKVKLQSFFAKHTKTKFSSKTHKPEDELNADGLIDEIATCCVKGWTGVTPEWLATRIPLDIKKFSNPKEEIEFNHDNLMIIVKKVYGFDSWLTEAVKDASNFNNGEIEAKN